MPTINRQLNLVVQIEREDAPVYVHSMPVGFQIFERYYLVLTKVFAAFSREGLSIIGGPRAAWYMLRDVAVATVRLPGQSWWEGEDGVEMGLMPEIVRLSNVLRPQGNGWQTVPLQNVLDEIDAFEQQPTQKRPCLTREEAMEALNQIAFFTVASRVPPPADREKFIVGGARLSNALTTSSTPTEFAASLRTSTTDEPSGEKATPSSVPR